MMSTASTIFALGITIALSLHNHETKPDRIHECVHDKLNKTTRIQRVKYRKHPYELLQYENDESILNRRKLIQDADYQSIRISPYYDTSSISTSNGLTTSQIAYIKQLISASITYFQSFIKVIPVYGPLLIDACPWTVKSKDDSFIYPRCTQQQIDQTCGSATIPDDHLLETWVYDSSTYTSTKYKSAGAGIADSDLVIYVTYGNTGLCASGTTLAYASQCSQDQFGRPIAGAINFCPLVLSSNYWKFDIVTTVHELTHVLVFSDFLWGYFYDVDSGGFKSDVTTTYSDNTWIITDKVKEIAQDHFDCDTLIGAPIETYYTDSASTTGSHWEAKYLNYEYMDARLYSSQMYVSKFTLAMMEDSGWYQIDYDYAEKYTWGQNQGCSFINDECISPSTQISNFPQFWCDDYSGSRIACTADYSSIGQCMSIGLSTHDGCTFVDSKVTYSADFENVCFDLRGNTGYDSYTLASSTYGVDSRCVQVISTTDVKDAYCFAMECTGYNAYSSSYSGVDITMNSNEIISCSQSDELSTKSVSTIDGVASIVCPNIDTICGSTTQPFACYYGSYNDDLGKCVCSPGYTGDDCNTEQTSLITEASLADGFIYDTTNHSKVCIAGIEDYLTIFNGVYTYIAQNEEVDAFYSSSIYSGVYLFYSRYYNEWSIGSTLGGTSRWLSCEVPIGADNDPDMEKCNGWLVWNNVEQQFILQSTIKATYDVDVCQGVTPEPTSDPTTSNPTTVSPTRPPLQEGETHSPTDSPTWNPANNEPTTEPTKLPTQKITSNNVSGNTITFSFMVTVLFICLK